MAVYHQSDLASWARCAAQVGYKRAGLPSKTNSAAAFGSVMHHSLEVLQRALHEQAPFETALKMAIETFTYYWHPAHIEAICDPVPPDGWLPRQGHSELRARGVDTIKKFADLIRYDDSTLLATEYPFIVPLPDTWDEDEGDHHWLAGAIDRLAIGLFLRRELLKIEDLKTGREQQALRYNLQFSGYALASMQKEFWTGARGEDGFGQQRGTELYERFKDAGRRGTWINLKTFKFQDAGWRGPVDYARFQLAVEQMHASIKADIYPLSLTGQNCQYCDFRSICGGTGLPDNDHGKPGVRA